MGVAIANALAMPGWLSVAKDDKATGRWQYRCHVTYRRGRTAGRSGVEGRGWDAQR